MSFKRSKASEILRQNMMLDYFRQFLNLKEKNQERKSKGWRRSKQIPNSIRALTVSWSLNHAQALVPSMIIALLHYGPFRLYKEGTPRGNSMHSSGSAIELIT